MNNRNDYKGIFYEDNSERKYYEGGAHFSYEALYQILKNIKKQQSLNENKILNKEKEIIKQVPIVSRQKNYSMKNIFSCDDQMKKNKIKKKNSGNNINNNINNNVNKDLNLKKINFIRNNVSKEKSLSKKKNKNNNMNQSNSVIHLNSGQCLNININNNFNNFININPNNNNINNKIILNNNSNSNPLRFLKELIDDNKSGKKKPQSRNSKSKGRNYKKKNNVNSSIELNNEYNYNYYLVEAGLDKSSKISGNKHSGKSTGAQPSNSVHNLSINAINGLNNLNLTKYSQNNVGFFNLNCLDNSVNNSKIINKKGNNRIIIDKENNINNNNNNIIHLENDINDKNENIKNKNKNKGALSLDKNINKMKFNSFINKNIQLNNFVKNNETKKETPGPIILNENNIKKLKNFNMTIFNMTSNKNKNSSIKEKKINFNLSNNKKINNNNKNNINVNPDINRNKNINKNIFNNNNRNFLKFSNQSLLKSICLQKQNSRNFFNASVKNKNQKNMPKKLSEKSCNTKEKQNEKQNNISRNSKINYDKLIKSFEI